MQGEFTEDAVIALWLAPSRLTKLASSSVTSTDPNPIRIISFWTGPLLRPFMMTSSFRPWPPKEAGRNVGRFVVAERTAESNSLALTAAGRLVLVTVAAL